jgi:hypothetical protein
VQQTTAAKSRPILAAHPGSPAVGGAEEVPAAVLAAVQESLKLGGPELLTAVSPGATAGVFFGGKADAGEAFSAPGAPSQLPAGKVAAAATRISATTAALPARLDHAEVLGPCSLTFINPGALASDWVSLERAATVHLRSSHIVKGLPTERFAKALGTLSYGAACLLYAWQALAVEPGHCGASFNRSIRDRLLRHLLATACPAAVVAGGDGGGDDSAMASSSAGARGPASSPLAASPSSALLQLQADGSRGVRLAPFTLSPLHWCYELLAGGLLLTLLDPRRGLVCRPAIDMGSAGEALLSPRRPTDDAIADGRQLLAPDAVWLWALSNILSDQTSTYALIQLRHPPAGGPPGHGVAAHLRPPPRLRPRQRPGLHVAVRRRHRAEPRRGGRRGHRPRRRHGRRPRRRGRPRARSPPRQRPRLYRIQPDPPPRRRHLLHPAHAPLRAPLHRLPRVLGPTLDALALLGSEQGGGAAKVPAPAAAAAVAAAVAAEGTAPAALQQPGESAVDSAAATPAAATAKHELATLRNRQATVAEACAGFLRALSLAKAPGSHAAGDIPGGRAAPVNGSVAFRASDASPPLCSPTLARRGASS